MWLCKSIKPSSSPAVRYSAKDYVYAPTTDDLSYPILRASAPVKTSTSGGPVPAGTGPPLIGQMRDEAAVPEGGARTGCSTLRRDGKEKANN